MDMEILLNGEIYDLRHAVRTADIDFYVDKAMEIGGPVLELCCGTGRIAVPMARNGLDVTGLDISEPMLAHAQQKAAAAGVNVEWILGDATSFDLGRKFQLIIVPFNSLQLLGREERVGSFFKSVCAHLKEGGTLIFDVHNPSLGALAPESATRTPGGEYWDPQTGELITIEWSSAYDDSEQVDHMTWYFSTPQRMEFATDHLVMRYYYPQELNLIVRTAGFNIIEKLGEFDGRPFGRGCPKQIVIARHSP